MKILKHGHVTPRLFVCQICGCEFVADRHEHNMITAGEVLLWYTADCPECGATTNTSTVWKEENE